MVQGYEMAIMIPSLKMQTVLDRLAKPREAGLPYPITGFFDSENTLLPSGQEQMGIRRKGGER